MDGAPGLQITFHKGLNALIGENDSGKTAVIDALKLVLLTQSNEYIRPVDEDFYTSANVAQCLASILRWEVSVIPEKLTQEKMFDVELYGLKTDEKKKVELSNKIENDSFLGYIVRAIKYASGIGE